MAGEIGANNSYDWCYNCSFGCCSGFLWNLGAFGCCCNSWRSKRCYRRSISGRKCLARSIVKGASGAVSGLIGGTLGKWAVKGLQNIGINGLTKFANSPVIKSALASGIAGTVAVGITGFGTELAMGGNFNDALNAGVNGAIVGGTIGALGECSIKTLVPGETITRYGNEEGYYSSPEGAPLESRSLHPFSDSDYQRIYVHFGNTYIPKNTN